MHKNLWRCPGSEWVLTCTHGKLLPLSGKFISLNIVTWFQGCRSIFTLLTCRFRHCYCWRNYKISYKKQPRPLADAHIDLERPAWVSCHVAFNAAPLTQPTWIEGEMAVRPLWISSLNNFSVLTLLFQGPGGDIWGQQQVPFGYQRCLGLFWSLSSMLVAFVFSVCTLVFHPYC